MDSITDRLPISVIMETLLARSQFVLFDSVDSSQATLSIGVPEGSVLYLIFINDIGNLPMSDKLNLFADSLLCSLCKRQEFNEDSEWFSYFRINKHTLNVTKSKFIIFKAKNKRVSHLGPIKIGNSQHESVS
jgi:hypothetical protein